MCTISNKIAMDFMLYFGEAITGGFFGLAIHRDRRVCISLSFWHFYNVDDNDKPHTVRKP